MKQIPLTQGQFAIVDNEDYVRVNCYNWHARWCPETKSFYAVRNLVVNEKRTTQQMHRLILYLESKDKRQVDHVNHDTLDNRRENIHAVTCRSNHHNRKNQSKLGFCIKYDKRNPNNPFVVQVHIMGRCVHVGCYHTIQEATTARDMFLSTNC
jgi:hypothetical protein